MTDILTQKWTTFDRGIFTLDHLPVAICETVEIAEAIVEAHNIMLMVGVISQNIILEKKDDGKLVLDLNTDMSALNNQFGGSE